MSMSSYLLQRLLAVLLLFCLSKASGGTCLSYGHSCWGGHGKRSGSAHMIGPSSQKHTSGWLISKFLDPPAAEPKDIEAIFKNKISDSDEVVAANPRQSGFQSFLGLDTERSTRREGVNSENDLKINKWDPESEEEVMVLAPEVQRVLPFSKLRLLPITVRRIKKKINQEMNINRAEEQKENCDLNE